MFGAMRARFPPTIRQLLSAPSIAQSKSTAAEVCGWIKSVRRQKNVTFAVVSDGSAARGMQAVFARGVVGAERLTNGCSVRLRGAIVPSRGPGQEREFKVKEVEMLGECDPELYPIQKQALTVDYLRDQCHLRARVDKIGQMLRVRDCLSSSLHRYFENESFMYAHAPIITSSDSEGAGEAFSVGPSEKPRPGEQSLPFFGKDAFLTVSSQLHLEALAYAHSRVYTLSPAFRAERSQTNRHLAEFWMLEAEWAFTRKVEEICDIVEDCVKYAVLVVVQEGEEDAELEAHVEKTLPLERRWSRITYSEAVERLRAARADAPDLFEFEPVWGSALQSEHEKWLADAEGGPVFVTDYPAALKPFYMRANDDGKTVACFDLLIPGIGELVGGSLREERLELLDDAMERAGLLGKEEYEWYRDLRRFGGAPHGGFGLGFERLVSAVTGQPNVRECIPMPRWAGRMLL